MNYVVNLPGLKKSWIEITAKKDSHSFNVKQLIGLVQDAVRSRQNPMLAQDGAAAKAFMGFVFPLQECHPGVAKVSSNAAIDDLWTVKRMQLSFIRTKNFTINYKKIRDQF